MFKPDLSRTWTQLGVDALAYHGALKAVAATEKAEKSINVARHRCDRLLAQFDSARRKNADLAESLAVQLEGAEFNLGRRYGPLLLGAVQAHTLAGLCLESHINSHAIQRLSKREFGMFERFTLEAKWFTLPTLINVGRFDVGAEPMRGIARLIRYRNALVHYKEHREDWVPPGVPSFLQELGLTREAAADSVETVRRAVTALRSLLGTAEPSWLSTGRSSYFRLVVESDRRG